MSKEIRPVYTLLSPDRVALQLTATDKADAIRQLVALLDGHPSVTNLEEVGASVLKRERVMSTGVGKGLALPHAKTDAVKDLVVALAITEEAIPFEAIDEQPVRILLLMVAPPDAAMQHIRLLGHIPRMMNREQFRHRLLHASDAASVLRFFEEEETRMRDEN